MNYFQYTLNDLEHNSAKKEFNYITFFAGGGGSSCAYKLGENNSPINIIIE